MLGKHNKHGFTLVEILIVVILLGILASVVLAMFRPATTDARQAALSENLGILRAQIQLYTLQHNDTSPDLSTTWDPLIAKTTDRGGNARGPYLPSIPRNPLNNRRVWGTCTTRTAVLSGGRTPRETRFTTKVTRRTRTISQPIGRY
jgi:prepilin-type N-terminal cleavage/methylation domain-containing protein